MEGIKIVTFQNPSYKKCECCDRVKDIFFRIEIFDYETKSMLSGSIDMCKTCGENFADYVGHTVIKERQIGGVFSFE